MKCSNCGAEISADSRVCEFCHTENPEWKERDKTRKYYDYKKQETEATVHKEFKTLWRDKLCVRFMYGAIFLFAGLIVAVFIAAFATEGAGKLRMAIHKNRYEREMSALYEEERYSELYNYMDKRGIDGQDYYKYMQVALRHEFLRDFRNYAYDVIDCIQNGKTLRYASNITSMLYYAEDVINSSGVYKITEPGNEEILDEFAEEVRLVLKTYCLLTDEEIDDAMGDGVTHDYVTLILERTGITVENKSY